MSQKRRKSVAVAVFDDVLGMEQCKRVSAHPPLRLSYVRNLFRPVWEVLPFSNFTLPLILLNTTFRFSIMPPKSIFRQPGAKHFQLVHRSQRDPLIHDPEASKHVLKEFERGNVKKVKEYDFLASTRLLIYNK